MLFFLLFILKSGRGAKFFDFGKSEEQCPAMSAHRLPSPGDAEQASCDHFLVTQFSPPDFGCDLENARKHPRERRQRQPARVTGAGMRRDFIRHFRTRAAGDSQGFRGEADFSGFFTHRDSGTRQIFPDFSSGFWWFLPDFFHGFSRKFPSKSRSRLAELREGPR